MNPLFDKRQQILGIEVEKHTDDTIYPPLKKRLDITFFFAAIAIAVVHNQVKAVVVERILNAAFKCRIKGIGDIGDDAGDGERLAGAQAPGGDIGNIAQFFHGDFDALPGGGQYRDALMVIDDVRDECLRDLGTLGDIRLGYATLVECELIRHEGNRLQIVKIRLFV